MSWDFPYRGETRELDDAARSAAGGSFVRLPAGCTHYEVSGPESQRPVVLVHGFSVPSFIWDTTFEALQQQGRRVLRYDLFGRGYSDRPNVRYDIHLFVEQLADLLDALHMGSIDLVGLSMGGAIAAAFTVQHPALVKHLALLDPVGTEPMPLNLLYKAALLPGISELLLSLLGNDRMVESLASDFFDPSEVARFKDRYRVQMRFRGFKRAILSTLRSGAVNGSPETYEKLGELSVPVLLLWGREDRTVPLQQSSGILSRVPQAHLHIIEGAGHIPNVEQPEVTHSTLFSFLGPP